MNRPPVTSRRVPLLKMVVGLLQNSRPHSTVKYTIWSIFLDLNKKLRGSYFSYKRQANFPVIIWKIYTDSILRRSFLGSNRNPLKGDFCLVSKSAKAAVLSILSILVFILTNLEVHTHTLFCYVLISTEILFRLAWTCPLLQHERDLLICWSVLVKSSAVHFNV